MYDERDSHFPAFETPRRILYNRIRDYFIKTRLAMVVDNGQEIYIVNEKAEVVLDKSDELTDRIYICLNTGRLVKVEVLRKNLGALVEEIVETFK